MADSTLVSKVKTSLRVSTTSFDTEIGDLVDAAMQDLNIAGVDTLTATNPLIIRAVTTYCKANFGDPDNYDRFKMAYDEQKAMLSHATGYHTWDDEDSDG